MNAPLVRRQAALAGVALLATVVSLVLGRVGDDERTETDASPAPTAPWQEAVASIIDPARYGDETACGFELTRGTRGVAHPVLPCGVDLVIGYRGSEIRTEVIERGPFEGGREFDLTRALAAALGLRGTQTIRWRFAA